MSKKKYGFKILRENLKSIGLLQAPILQYHFNIWNRPKEPISSHPQKGGGIWVCPDLRYAKKFQKYVLEQHGIKAIIFRCQIGKILYQSSCRIKTDKIFFTKKDKIIKASA